MTSLKVVLFAAAAERIWDKKPDGVVIVPQNFDVTQAFCRRLQEQDIPFVFLDSNVPEIEPLAFFGQDSLKSGYFAGRIFMMQAGEHARRILLMKLMSKGRVASRQQEYREVGFREYMTTYYPDCEVVELSLQLTERTVTKVGYVRFWMNIRMSGIASRSVHVLTFWVNTFNVTA